MPKLDETIIEWTGVVPSHIKMRKEQLSRKSDSIF
jgi:hypothetical protein